MSLNPLSDIQGYLERSVFHRIRTECVDKGYLPDINLYPNTPAGQLAWETALQAIVVSKKFAIEVFNYASPDARMLKKVPRIVINSQGFLPGALGGDSSRYFVKESGGSYTAMILPPQTVDYYINVHLIGNTVEQMRILQAILALSVPRRAYIPSYLHSQDGNTFFIRNTGYSAVDANSEGIIEKIYSYEIPDMWETLPTVAQTGIAPLADITIVPDPNMPNAPMNLHLASPACTFTTFTIPNQVSSIIDVVNGIININMPTGTDVSALIATFTFSNLLTTAKIGGVDQESGTTPNDFTTSNIYTVTAADGITTKDYTVAVTVL